MIMFHVNLPGCINPFFPDRGTLGVVRLTSHDSITKAPVFPTMLGRYLESGAIDFFGMAGSLVVPKGGGCKLGNVGFL